MKKLLLAISALAALSLLAPSAGVAQWADPAPRNQIGIYTTAAPTPEQAQDQACYTGAPGGSISAYVVITNPWNLNPYQGQDRPITLIGGFEFHLYLPDNVFLLGNTLPPNSTNFATAPDFFVGAAAPVTANGVATLVTLTLGEFTGTPGDFTIGPVTSLQPSVPGNMAITDYNDDFSITIAHPASGDFALPVFSMYECNVLPTEPASWGGIKSLYR